MPTIQSPKANLKAELRKNFLLIGAGLYCAYPAKPIDSITVRRTNV